MAKNFRTVRVLQLIAMLQSGRGHNVASLASACQVSRRTIFRDLDTLRDAGVPVRFDSERQHFHIPGQYYLPPTNFTHEEALAVIVLCHELGTDNRLPCYDAAVSAAIKLENCLPANLREEVREVASRMNIRLQSANTLDDHRDHYNKLVQAIGDRQCVRIQYGSVSEGQPIQTKLNPYQMLFNRRSWYIVGRSSIHRATRTFNIGRILHLEVLDEKFKLPKNFSIDRYLGNAWNLIPEPGPDHDIHLRFQPKVAQNVAEVNWHKTQQTEYRDDGSLDFHVTVSGLQEISWWILGYGDTVELISPRRLRNMILARIQKSAAIYEETPRKKR